MSVNLEDGQGCTSYCTRNIEASEALLKQTRRPYPDYTKLPSLHYLSWSETPNDDHEPDDFQPQAQIKRLFEENKLVRGDSEAIRKFSQMYIVPERQPMLTTLQG